MKKHFFLLSLIAILALTLFIFSGMNNGNSDDFFPFSAFVEVAELNKDRTHTFNLFSDGKRTLLNGYFSIDNKKYPGKILFDGNHSYLFRPDPDQAVVYSNKNQIIYGFLPVNPVINNDHDSVNITVLDKDEKGFPIRYEIEYWDGEEKQKSIVSFSNIVSSDRAIDEIEFALPQDTRYIPVEGYIKV
jgi:hypothetical protein